MKSRWLDTGAGRCSRRVLGTALAIAWCTAPRAVHAQDDILEAEEAAGEGLEEGGESGLEPEGAGEDLDAATEPQSEAPAIFDDSMLEAGVEGGALEGGAESAASDGEVFVDDDIEEITVTGSRIKRTIFSAAAPVEVMNREQIEKTGSQNMEDLLQHMTISTGSGYRGGGGGPGTAQVNLRGLGAGATLVLINGRRVVPSAAGITVAFTDISTIPLSVVERVEVLKGGASAIYGSDAIAGVVNIITRKDWQGVRVQADGRATTNEFDQRAGTVSVAMGASAGDVRVTGGISYYRSTQLLANKRDFTLEEGPDGGQGGNRSLGGQPGTYIAGGLIADPNCDSVPGSRVEMTDVGDLCSFSFNDFRALTPNTERTALYLHGEYDLSDHTRMFMEANVSKTRTDAISSPSFSFTIRPVIPADHVDNPFGVDATFIGRPLGAASGGAITETDDDTLRTAFGFRGDLEDIAANTFFETWSWELFTTFGVSRYSRFLPDTVFPDFVEAVNSCTDASDLSECFNPFAAGTPNPTSVTRGFTGALMTTVDQHLQTYNAGMSGTLLELPGGDLGIAFGGALRQEQRTSQLDHDTNEFDLSFYFGDDDAEAERDVIAGYMELVLPFYEGIEMQAAARVEDYSDAGSAVNPGVGLVLMPGTIAGSDS
ncbi:MAG: TonB-dependent receptor plug domain-containing protein, partial [Myxococcales bacterium]